jgi:hypothetical protein
VISRFKTGSRHGEDEVVCGGDPRILGKIAPVLLICIALFFLSLLNFAQYQMHKRTSEALLR